MGLDDGPDAVEDEENVGEAGHALRNELCGDRVG